MSTFQFVEILRYQAHDTINKMIADYTRAIKQDDGSEYRHSVPVEIYKARKIAINYMRRTWPWECEEYEELPEEPVDRAGHQQLDFLEPRI